MSHWQPYDGPRKPHIYVEHGHWVLDSTMGRGPDAWSICRESPERYAQVFGWVRREARALYRLDAAVTLTEHRRRRGEPLGARVLDFDLT